MRKAAVALAGLLAVILAWHTWRAPETAVVKKPTAPTRQAIASEARVESGIESQLESAASKTQDPVSSPDTSLAPSQAEENTEESSAAIVDYSESPLFITNELPSYLESYASQRDPNSRICMNAFDLLNEMQKLARNEASDARTERNLKDLLEPHPLGFPVTITCGGGICQVSDLGPDEKIRERNIEYDTYWGEFGQRLYRVDPIASQLATFALVFAEYPKDTSQSITAFILTTKARVITADSLNCPSLNVSKRK